MLLSMHLLIPWLEALCLDHPSIHPSIHPALVGMMYPGATQDVPSRCTHLHMGVGSRLKNLCFFFCKID